jgi:hypothetical protein
LDFKGVFAMQFADCHFAKYIVYNISDFYWQFGEMVFGEMGFEMGIGEMGMNHFKRIHFLALPGSA